MRPTDHEPLRRCIAELLADPTLTNTQLEARGHYQKRIQDARRATGISGAHGRKVPPPGYKSPPYVKKPKVQTPSTELSAWQRRQRDLCVHQRAELVRQELAIFPRTPTIELRFRHDSDAVDLALGDVIGECDRCRDH